MRQRQKQHIARSQGIRVDELQIDHAAQIRMHAVDVLSGVLAAGDLRHLRVGVEVQQTQQFAARVAAAAHNADTHALGHGHTFGHASTSAMSPTSATSAICASVCCIA